MSESLSPVNHINKRLSCTFDDFSVNNYLNRILKSTLLVLLKSNIKSRQRKNLRKILIFFSDIGTLDLRSVDWNIRFNRNNLSYRMLITICYLTVEGLLQDSSGDEFKVSEVLDEQRMSRLYEKFILEYYKREYSNLKVHAPRIN